MLALKQVRYLSSQNSNNILKHKIILIVLKIGNIDSRIYPKYHSDKTMRLE